MIISSAISRRLTISGGPPSGPLPTVDGFIEFTSAGVQSILSTQIPAGVIRVRVHLIGAGGGPSGNYAGGDSIFSANGVSVTAGGGLSGGVGDYVDGGSGGSVYGQTGVISSASGGYPGTNAPGAGSLLAGYQGSLATTSDSVAMGGGGGGGGYDDNCHPPYFGGYGGVGRNAGGAGSYGAGGSGGAGGGYGSGNSLVLSLALFSSSGGQGAQGINNSNEMAAGGGGAYAIFYATIYGGVQYTNAVTIGGAGYNAQNGYCRIQWGPSI